MDPKISEWLQEGMKLGPETGNILEVGRMSTKGRGYTIINCIRLFMWLVKHKLATNNTYDYTSIYFMHVID